MFGSSQHRLLHLCGRAVRQHTCRINVAKQQLPGCQRSARSRCIRQVVDVDGLGRQPGKQTEGCIQLAAHAQHARGWQRLQQLLQWCLHHPPKSAQAHVARRAAHLMHSNEVCAGSQIHARHARNEISQLLQAGTDRCRLLNNLV